MMHLRGAVVGFIVAITMANWAEGHDRAAPMGSFISPVRAYMIPMKKPEVTARMLPNMPFPET